MIRERKIKGIILIVLLILNLFFHLVATSWKRAFLGPFFTAYMTDIILPWYFYALISFIVLKNREKKHLLRIVTALAVFMMGAILETLQYFNIKILGSTFDPLDYAMYFIGVLGGVLVDYSFDEAK